MMTSRVTTSLNTLSFVGSFVASSALLSSPALAGGGGDSMLRDHAINFVVFVALIVIAARKPIANALNARADAITKDIQEAQTALEQAQDALAKYEGMIADLESEREALLEQYRSQGEREKQALIDEGKRDAERLAADAQRTAESELVALQRKIESELIDSALTKAEALLKEGVKAADHKRLTQD